MGVHGRTLVERGIATSVKRLIGVATLALALTAAPAAPAQVASETVPVDPDGVAGNADDLNVRIVAMNGVKPDVAAEAIKKIRTALEDCALTSALVKGWLKNIADRTPPGRPREITIVAAPNGALRDGAPIRLGAADGTNIYIDTADFNKLAERHLEGGTEAEKREILTRLLCETIIHEIVHIETRYPNALHDDFGPNGQNPGVISITNSALAQLGFPYRRLQDKKCKRGAAAGWELTTPNGPVTILLGQPGNKEKNNWSRALDVCTGDVRPPASVYDCVASGVLGFANSPLQSLLTDLTSDQSDPEDLESNVLTDLGGGTWTADGVATCTHADIDAPANSGVLTLEFHGEGPFYSFSCPTVLLRGSGVLSGANEQLRADISVQSDWGIADLSLVNVSNSAGEVGDGDGVVHGLPEQGDCMVEDVTVARFETTFEIVLAEPQ